MPPQTDDIPPDWYRDDGTLKGLGFLGPLKLPNGIASEFSIADSEKLRDARGRYIDYPTLVPTLTREEVQAVLRAASDHTKKTKLPNSVYDKAESFALQRRDKGLPFFARPDEVQNLYPDVPRGPVPDVIGRRYNSMQQPTESSTSEMPLEIRAFAEAARKNGYSDSEIVAYMQKKRGEQSSKEFVGPRQPSQEPDTFAGGAWKGFMEGAQDGLYGMAKGIVKSPVQLLRGVAGMVTDPAGALLGAAQGLENIPDAVMSAGAHPEEFGEGVGSLMGQAAIGEMVPGALRMGARLPARAAEIAVKHPVATGAAIGAIKGGPMGALEGALGGGVAGRLLKRAGDMGGEATPTAVPTVAKAPPTMSIPPLSDAEYLARTGKPRLGTPNAPPPAVRMGASPVGAVNSTVDRLNTLIRNDMADSRGLPPGRPEMDMPPSSIPDPSFVRGVPAEPAMAVAHERVGLPPHTEGIPLPPSPNDASFVRSIPAEVEEIVTDPKTGRGKRAYSSGAGAPLPVKEGVIVETPKPVASHAPAASSLATEVARLDKEGHAAGAIASKLKDHPDLKGMTAAERTNAVREARGGDAGQIRGRVKQAIDDALNGMKTDAEKRAYLLKAPNATVYTYIKGKLGL